MGRVKAAGAKLQDGVEAGGHAVGASIGLCERREGSGQG